MLGVSVLVAEQLSPVVAVGNPLSLGQQAKSEGLRWSGRWWAVVSPPARGEQRAFTFLLIKGCDLIGGVNADLLLSHLMGF